MACMGKGTFALASLQHVQKTSHHSIHSPRVPGRIQRLLKVFQASGLTGGFGPLGGKEDGDGTLCIDTEPDKSVHFFKSSLLLTT